MGLIAAAVSSTGSVIKDQYKEYFYCESIPSDTLVVKGKKKDTGKGNKGTDNIISNGSVIAVADGQCMIIVDQGKIIDLCAEPGEYTYDMSTEPSIFEGKLGGNIKAIFKTIGKRIAFGGEAPKDQRIYYFNTKEIMGNKYGTANPVPFRVVDQRAGIDIDISMKCFGEYSYRITNPMLFYVNVCGNIHQDFKKSDIESQLRSEFLTALQPAFGKISEMGIRYSSVMNHTKELSDAMRDELSQDWGERRGIEVGMVGISSISANEEDEKMLKELQRNAAFVNPNLAGAYMVGATGAAMQTAAGNAAGAAVGLMGMNMVNNAGGINTAGLYAMGQQQAPAQAAPAQAAPAADSWTCPSCGKSVSGNFCPECGAKKPVADTWTCSCGTVNKGNFCSNCGAKKPSAAVCKCGYKAEDPANPPKFCPNCGEPFGK